MPVRVSLVLVLTVLSLCLLPLAPALAQTPSADGLAILSPLPGSTVGGLVAVWGTASLPRMRSYSLAFAPSRESARWIAIGEPREEPASAARLALWDTTGIPDGVYTLRLRAQLEAANGSITYQDLFSENLLVSNAPKTPTPYPTASPTATPTPTALPTATPTTQPTPSLDEGISPHLYLTMQTQHDPLCPEWSQRFGFWVTNVGTVTVTNIILVSVPPEETEPVLSASTEGAELAENGLVSWEVPDLAPGQAAKFELQIAVPEWLDRGTWLTQRVQLFSDQVPYLANSQSFLLDECPWLEATLAALPLPTAAPTETPEPEPTADPGQALTRPTAAWPTPTPLNISIPEETVDRSLDLMTQIITGVLGLLVVIMVVMLYRRLGPKR